MRNVSDTMIKLQKSFRDHDRSGGASPFFSHHLHQHRQEVSEKTSGQDLQPVIERENISKEQRISKQYAGIPQISHFQI